MKKLVAMILVLTMALCFAVPVMAASQEKELGTRGSLSLSGGMKLIGGQYYIYGEAFGGNEQKTVTVTLHRKSGNYTWTFVDSVSNSGTTPTVQTSKPVTLEYSGEYRVLVSGMTGNSSGTTDYYYNVTV